MPPGPLERSAAPWSQGPEESPEGLLTQEGGLFYLIDFLARPEAQALLACDPGALDSGGWAWLAALGLSLGMAPEGPLAGFLAERLEMDPHLGIADLTLPDCTQALMDLGARLYGESEVWGPGLLRVQAEVALSPSHLDCHYPLACVRLAVRRVALDVNPGWVPWLGRVVTFHYDAPGRPLDRP